MKILFRCIWGLWSATIVVAMLFNHHIESYLNEDQLDLLFKEYSKQWAYTNAVITCIWLILNWIGLHLYLRKDRQ